MLTHRLVDPCNRTELGIGIDSVTAPIRIGKTAVHTVLKLGPPAARVVVAVDNPNCVVARHVAERIQAYIGANAFIEFSPTAYHGARVVSKTRISRARPDFNCFGTKNGNASGGRLGLAKQLPRLLALGVALSLALGWVWHGRRRLQSTPAVFIGTVVPPGVAAQRSRDAEGIAAFVKPGAQ